MAAKTGRDGGFVAIFPAGRAEFAGSGMPGGY